MERLNREEFHDSIRGHFAGELYNAMIDNPDITVITADLGYAMFDKIKADFPDRFINTGASEMAAMGIAVGMAEEGRIPVVYSITPFLLYRPAEIIRNYINHEKIAVNLIASGRDQDYEHDGFSHFAGDDKAFLQQFTNIQGFWPMTKSDMKYTVQWIQDERVPKYINLKRG